MKKMLILLSLAFVSVSVVRLLHGYATRDRDKDNGFYRSLPPHVISMDSMYDLHVNSYYIAGFAADHIYLGNSTVPNRLLALHLDFTDTSQWFVDTGRPDTLWGVVRSWADSSCLYITQTGHPGLYAMSRRERLLRKRPLHAGNVTELRPLSGSTVVGKRIEGTHIELFKENLDNGTITSRVNLGNTTEDFFLADGILSRQPLTGNVFYTWYYQNKFICLDSNLRIVYTHHTIDTSVTPQVGLATLSRNTVLSVASTPRYVNKASFVSDSLVFIQSAIRGNTEDPEGFRESLVIDVYYAASGHYLFSFYMPLFQGLKCTAINVYGNRIYAIYDRYLWRFTLHLSNYRGVFR